MFRFGGGEVGRLGDNAVEADWIEGLVTVVKTEFGDHFGLLRNDPQVVIKAADVCTSTGIE